MRFKRSSARVLSFVLAGSFAAATLTSCNYRQQIQTVNQRAASESLHFSTEQLKTGSVTGQTTRHDPPNAPGVAPAKTGAAADLNQNSN